jgi:hypothetical protein
VDITLDVHVDELVAVHPEAAGFLADNNVVCIVCGEPYWGTLGELMEGKGIDNPEVLLDELKTHLGA